MYVRERETETESEWCSLQSIYSLLLMLHATSQQGTTHVAKNMKPSPSHTPLPSCTSSRKPGQDAIGGGENKKHNSTILCERSSLEN